MVKKYLVGNGVSKPNCFVKHIYEHNQCIYYFGVNMNNQNVVSERLICTVSEMACSTMLHSYLCWKNVIGSNLWPIATSYATYIYNHIPNSEYIAYDDIFTGTNPLPTKISKIFTFGVSLSTSWIPCFNKVVNSQNGSHGLVTGYFLDSFQIIHVLLLWSSTQLFSISPHNSMWSLMISS